jgi:hypothetical protein
MTYRLLLLAWIGLAGILPADGRPWIAVPLCLVALAATGALWTRALPDDTVEAGLPAVRGGLAAIAGLVTLPLLAVLLHAAGQPVRPVPLVASCAVLAGVLAAVAVLRERRAARRSAPRAGLPVQRRHVSGSPFGPSSGLLSGGGHPVSGPEDDAPPTDSSSTPASSASASAAASGERSGADLTDDGVSPTPRRYVRTTAAVAIPVALAVGVGGVTVRGYLAAARPAEPGYLSVALNGWAAAIDSPVTVPSRGLVVPVRVTSAGLGTTTSMLQLRVGGKVVASRPMTVTADSVRSLTVYVPALPPDGCLHPVAISVGDTSTGFYARGHADAAPARRTTTGAAVTGPGVRSHDRAAAGGLRSRDRGAAVAGAGVRSRAAFTEPGPGGEPASATRRGDATAERAAC